MAEANIYKIARELADELQNSEAFVSLKKALDDVHQDQQANAVFEALKKAQQDIQDIHEAGNQPTEQDIEKWEAAAQQAQGVDQIQKLSEAEQKINAVLQEINDLITDPLNKVY